MEIKIPPQKESTHGKKDTQKVNLTLSSSIIIKNITPFVLNSKVHHVINHISESQLIMKKQFKQNGYKFILSNDYDLIITKINEHVHGIYIYIKQFLSDETYQNHLQKCSKIINRI